MRIGLVTQAYYPVLGGVTEHVWHLGTELQRRGHQVTVITGGTPYRLTPGKSTPPDDRGLRVLRHGYQIPFMTNGANVHVTIGWKLGRLLQRLEQQEKFDLVHVQSPLDPGLPLIASKAMRTPKVGTYHTFREATAKGLLDNVPIIFKDVFLDAIAKIQAHVAVSPAAEEFVHRYFPHVKMTVIPNGIDPNLFSPKQEPFAKYQDGKLNILFVGRMDPRKGAKYLFGALPFLEEKLGDGYRVIVVGTGWMQKYYDAYIPLNLRHRVEFTGFASSEDLPRYYRSADIYCSPATGGESFGIVLLQAMASGVPIVASDIDGYRWVVTPGQEGILVPPRSSGHIAEAILKLADDPAWRKKMGVAGLATAQKYSWSGVTDQIEKVYRSVLDAAPARA